MCIEVIHRCERCDGVVESFNRICGSDDEKAQCEEHFTGIDSEHQMHC